MAEPDAVTAAHFYNEANQAAYGLRMLCVGRCRAPECPDA